MRKRDFLFIVLGLILAVSPAYANQSLESEISRVTLFNNQALIQRTAVAQVPAGQMQLQLEVDAFYVDRDSVTAKINGAGEIFGVQYKSVPVSESPQADLHALEEALLALEKTRRGFVDQKKVLKQKMAFLNGFIDFAKIQTAKELKTAWPKMADLENTIGFLGDNYQKLFIQQQVLDDKIKTVADKIDVIKRQMAAMRGTRPKNKQVIEVLFKSDKSQKIRVTTEYLVKRATWQPLYRVMVSPSLSVADLNMFAQISQKTGENWENVALSVSNVMPLKGVGVPQLNSWKLDIPRPRIAALKSSSRDSIRFEKEAAMAPTAMPKEEAAFASAKRRHSGLAFAYELSQPVTIPSSPQKTMAPLFTKKLKGEFVHLSAPKQRPVTFLVGTFKADKELLAGALNVYFGGRYVGKTYLEEKKAAAAFRINLGADREVLVKRQKIKDKIKESFFGTVERATVVRELAYSIVAENLKDKPVRLHILDNLPVSRTDKIVVKNVQLAPKPTQQNFEQREGVTLWELNLKPSEKTEINISYVVTYPKDAAPMGF
jgi:uncharacterized protein (TIGR02231 family)